MVAPIVVQAIQNTVNTRAGFYGGNVKEYHQIGDGNVYIWDLAGLERIEYETASTKI